jgi:hypothetical protein
VGFALISSLAPKKRRAPDTEVRPSSQCARSQLTERLLHKFAVSKDVEIIGVDRVGVIRRIGGTGVLAAVNAKGPDHTSCGCQVSMRDILSGPAHSHNTNGPEPQR